MFSYNDCIKFLLDIKDLNLVFEDYFYKIINQTKYKIFKAVTIQPACSECGSVNLLHNGRLQTNIKYITANASCPVIIRLYKQRVLCKDCHN